MLLLANSRNIQTYSKSCLNLNEGKIEFDQISSELVQNSLLKTGLNIKHTCLYFMKPLFVYIYVAPSKPWAKGYKCPSGSGVKVFDGNLGYDLEKAKKLCASACEDDYHCMFGQMIYMNSKQSCYLKGKDCGDWYSNRHWAYYVYQKGMMFCW